MREGIALYGDPGRFDEYRASAYCDYAHFADLSALEDEPFRNKDGPHQGTALKFTVSTLHASCTSSPPISSYRFDSDPRYYRLIEAFRDLTGVPIVLNTSFNENEPVVCRPEEALDCFLRTRMDMLVMGNWMLTREQVQ